MHLKLQVILLCSFFSQIYAPLPRCGPFTFFNKFVEQRSLQWLFHDLPGHPVPPCPYRDPRDAPLSDRSIFLRPLSHPDNAFQETRRTIEFFIRKGFPRILKRLNGECRSDFRC